VCVGVDLILLKPVGYAAGDGSVVSITGIFDFVQLHDGLPQSYPFFLADISNISSNAVAWGHFGGRGLRVGVGGRIKRQ